MRFAFIVIFAPSLRQSCGVQRKLFPCGIGAEVQLPGCAAVGCECGQVVFLRETENEFSRRLFFLKTIAGES